MFNYKQFLHIVDFNYVGGNFCYKVHIENGVRKELKNSNLIKTIISDNSFYFDLKSKLSSSQINNLKQFFKKIYDKLKRDNIDFSSFIKLYNEKIIINNIKDDIRTYAFCKIILMDCFNNFYMDDISIFNSSIEDLKIKILKIVKNNTKIINKTKKTTVSKLKFDAVPVVFSSKAAGYFMHEILGHSLESDFFSNYKNNFNNLKISNKLTVIDSIKGIENIVGLNKYDDQGENIKPLTVIKQGKICNIFSINKQDSLDGLLYGFARRESYKTNVMPRMRCTITKPFDNINEENIISKYNKAVYFNKAYIGGVNPQTGKYNLMGDGFLIKNGEKECFISNLKIYGNLLNDLSSFEYIGNDLKIFANYCSKFGQTVRVATGSPTISLKNLSLEGSLHEHLC